MKKILPVLATSLLCGCTMICGKTAPQVPKSEKAVSPVTAAPKKTSLPKTKPVTVAVPENKKTVPQKKNTPAPPVKSPVVKPPVPATILPPPPPSPVANGRPDAALRRAFLRLSPQEQQEMIKLQHQDLDKFRQLMQKKVEFFRAQERAKQQELDLLVQKYNSAKNETEKQAIKAELRKKLREHLDSRLAESRRNLEANRKRLEKMESELQKREKKRDAIVEAMLNHRISGQKPSRPVKKR